MRRGLPESKLCPRCGDRLPATAFYVTRGGMGLSSWCKGCQREYNRTRDRKGERWGRWIFHGRYVKAPEKVA